MKKQKIYVLIFFLITVVLFVFFKNRSGETSIAPRKSHSENKLQDTTEKKESSISNLWVGAFKSPVNFWGKVVDQNRNPVSGAKISILLHQDSSWSFEGGKNPRFEIQSDVEGNFELLGKRGASIAVEVSAEGYAPVFDQKLGGRLSRKELDYYSPSDSQYNPLPTKENPTIFVLRKKAEPANLLNLNQQSVILSKEGRVHLLSFDLGNNQKTLKIEVRCWSKAPEVFSYNPYDWRAEIRIKNGKLQPVQGFGIVEAPVDGYLPISKIDMPVSLNEDWFRSETKDYWIRLSDGSYGKVSVDIQTGRKHKVSISGVYNLDNSNSFEL